MDFGWSDWRQEVREIERGFPDRFRGAMGLPLEYPLHLSTYRLKLLQEEAGGKRAQAWPGQA